MALEKQHESLLNLVGLEIENIKIKHGNQADLVERLDKMKAYAVELIVDTKTTEAMKTLILFQFQSYLQALNEDNIELAGAILDQLREEYPKPSLILGMLLMTAIDILFIVVCLAPIPLIILCTPIAALLFLVSVPLAFSIHEFLRKSLLTSYALDTINNDSAEQAWAIGRSVHFFFEGKHGSETSPEKESDSNLEEIVVEGGDSFGQVSL